MNQEKLIQLAEDKAIIEICAKVCNQIITNTNNYANTNISLISLKDFTNYGEYAKDILKICGDEFARSFDTSLEKMSSSHFDVHLLIALTKAVARIGVNEQNSQIEAQVLSKDECAKTNEAADYDIDTLPSSSKTPKESQELPSDSAFIPNPTDDYFETLAKETQAKEDANLKHLDFLLTSLKNNIKIDNIPDSTKNVYQILHNSLENYIKDRPEIIKNRSGQVVVIGQCPFGENFYKDGLYTILSTRNPYPNTHDRIYMKIGSEAPPTTNYAF